MGRPIRKGPASGNWKGGRIISTDGYVHIYKPEHPRASKDSYVKEHLLIAEAAVGRFLPSPIEIHHIDENRQNNRNDNLVICPNTIYHQLLHTRLLALKACSDPNKRKCTYCKGYDFVENLVQYKGHISLFHKICRNSHLKNKRLIRKTITTKTITN